MSSLLSSDICEAVWEQIIQEKYNENLYLSIAAFLKNKGLDNLAKKFEGQATEESSHAKMFIDFLTDMNAEVRLGGVPPIDFPISTLGDIAFYYLQRETATTKSIASLKEIAIDLSESVGEEFFRKMISLQQHEYNEANVFSDKVSLIEGNWGMALLWDAAEK